MESCEAERMHPIANLAVPGLADRFPDWSSSLTERFDNESERSSSLLILLREADVECPLFHPSDRLVITITSLGETAIIH
jgi:hypothetical protein